MLNPAVSTPCALYVLQVMEHALHLDKVDEPDCGELVMAHDWDNTSMRRISAQFSLAIGNNKKQQLAFESENCDEEGTQNVTASLTWAGKRRVTLWDIDLEASRSSHAGCRTRELDSLGRAKWSKEHWEQLRVLSGFGTVDTRAIECFAKDVSAMMLRKLEEECGEEDVYGVSIGLQASDFDCMFGIQKPQQQQTGKQKKQQGKTTKQQKQDVTFKKAACRGSQKAAAAAASRGAARSPAGKNRRSNAAAAAAGLGSQKQKQPKAAAAAAAAKKL